MRRAWALTLVATAVAAGTLASTARANGDPASDILLTQKVFFPLGVKIPAKQQAELAGLVEAANRAGFKLRVAVIASSYDMGSVIALYRKPRAYARFLGSEIAFVYTQRLLVVMPNGFGFNWPKHSAAPSYAVLGTIRIKLGVPGQLDAARTAVKRLTADAGIKVAAPTKVTPPRQGNSRERLIIIAAALAALLLAVAARFALRR